MARQNGGEIRHFRRAETTSFHRQNRCAPEIRKNSRTILRLKGRKVRKIRYAAAGISRYRLINEAPTDGNEAERAPLVALSSVVRNSGVLRGTAESRGSKASPISKPSGRMESIFRITFRVTVESSDSATEILRTVQRVCTEQVQANFLPLNTF